MLSISLCFHGCFHTVCGLKSLYHIWFHLYVCNLSLVVFGSYNHLTSYHGKFVVMGILVPDKEDMKVLAVAVFAWCARECADIISLLLIFTVGMKDGLLHAIYSNDIHCCCLAS